jgi:hypothetical protein
MKHTAWLHVDEEVVGRWCSCIGVQERGAEVCGNREKKKKLLAQELSLTAADGCDRNVPTSTTTLQQATNMSGMSALRQ